MRVRADPSRHPAVGPDEYDASAAHRHRLRPAAGVGSTVYTTPPRNTKSAVRRPLSRRHAPTAVSEDQRSAYPTRPSPAGDQDDLPPLPCSFTAHPGRPLSQDQGSIVTSRIRLDTAATLVGANRNAAGASAFSVSMASRQSARASRAWPRAGGGGKERIEHGVGVVAIVDCVPPGTGPLVGSARGARVRPARPPRRRRNSLRPAAAGRSAYRPRSPSRARLPRARPPAPPPRAGAVPMLVEGTRMSTWPTPGPVPTRIPPPVRRPSGAIQGRRGGRRYRMDRPDILVPDPQQLRHRPRRHPGLGPEDRTRHRRAIERRHQGPAHRPVGQRSAVGGNRGIRRPPRDRAGAGRWCPSPPARGRPGCRPSPAGLPRGSGSG